MAGDRRPNGDPNRFSGNRRDNNWNQHRNQFNNWTQNNYYGGGHGYGGYGYGGWNNWWGPVAFSGVTGFLGGYLTGSLIGGHGYGYGGYGYSEPVYTSYGGGGGSTVYEGGDTIVVNGTSQPAAEYAQQAETIADNYSQVSQDVGSPSSDPQDWMPLGLYALTDDNSTADPTQYVQLVISKSGAVGGELHDLKTDTSTPVEGSIDPKTERVAWKISGTDTVMETGLYNLTQSETPVLIHDGTGRTTQRLLARIEDPKLAQATTAQPAGVGM